MEIGAGISEALALAYFASMLREWVVAAGDDDALAFSLVNQRPKGGFARVSHDDNAVRDLRPWLA